MELINATKFQAAYTMGTDPSAREHIVVAVKGTFAFPERDGDVCPLADEQVPLVMADEYWGEPGYSSPRYEVDFALRKPKCDVLLNATAHAPGGRAAERVRVGVKIGAWSKVIDVVGDRIWLQRGATLGPSAPEPFVALPLTYERAFGGVDDTDPERPDAYMPNPIGRGHGLVRSGERVTGRPLPNTEEPGQPVTVPWGAYRSMSLGVRARNWHPRLSYAGTYDQRWLDDVFPFLPADFDDRYFQAAPEDQWLDEPAGGEEVLLAHLTPEGRTRFRLPPNDLPVVFFRKDAGREERRATLDTILLEPDAGRLMLTWRASVPLRRNVFELVECLVGRMPRAWWRARELGKTYYPSLDDLIRSRHREEAGA
jgi:hypothetical protein